MAKTVFAVGDCAAAQAGGSSINKSCKTLVTTGGSYDEFWFLGDVYNDGTAGEFSNDFDPLWGTIFRAGKGRSTPGNHGWANHTSGFDHYHAQSGDVTFVSPHYGSYMLGDWMIIWINSMEGASTSQSPVPESAIVLGQASGPAKTMMNWLSALFVANPGTAKIVICHHNIWASGGHNDLSQMQPLWQMLPGNAALVFTGHTHNNEYHQPRNKAGNVVAFNQGRGAGTPGDGATIAVLNALAGNRDQLSASYTPAPTYKTDVSPAKAGVTKLVLSDTGLANPTCTVTFVNVDGSTNVMSQVVATAIGGGGVGTAPTNTSLPTLSDSTPVVGQVLTTGGGIWNGSPTPTLAYQWQISNTGVGGWTSATGTGNATSSYTVAGGDVGKFLRVQVVGTNPAGSATANSASSSAVGSAPTVPVNTVQPALTDTNGNSPPIVGDVLSTTNGTFSGTPTSYARTWHRRNPSTGATTTIAGQTGTTYTLVAADLGFQIGSSVIATNGSGSSDPAPSAWSSTVSTGGGGLQGGVTEHGGIFTVEVVVPASAVTLQATLDSDNARVQLLVNAAGMDTVKVSRTHPSGLVWTVRGIDTTQTSGDTFLGYDYELPIGRQCTYVAEAWDSGGADLGTSLGVEIEWDSQFDYLKDPSQPARNMAVTINAKPQDDFATPLGVLTVVNRPAPVTIGDVRQAATGQLVVVTQTIDEALRLHTISASGHVLLLQSSPESEVGNMYVALSGISEVRVAGLRDEATRLWQLSYQETDPPVGGITGGFATFQTILDTETSFASLLSDFTSYLDLLERIGVGGPSTTPELAWRGA